MVTGGTRGIGLATARELATHGYAVAVTFARDEEAAAAARSELEKLAPERVAVIQADATSWEDGERAVRDAEERLGPLAALVNNVGWGMMEPLEETSPERWRRMWSINLESAAIHATAAGRRMLERGRGAIVNVSSVSGERAFAGRGAHCVAKAGLNMLTQCLALEWGPRGVRANGVAPGVVATDYVQGMMDRGLVSEEAAVHATPLGRLATEEEIARAVRFLLSDSASYVNGHVLVVDGGWLTHAGDF